MPTPQTIPNTISLSKINMYLSQSSVDQSGIFSKRFLAKNLPQIIDMARQSIEWMYSNNPNEPTLAATSNYLFDLCDQNAKAQQILNGGAGLAMLTLMGSGISVITTAISKEDIDGVVGINGGLPLDGSTTWTLTDFVGYRVRLYLNGMRVNPISYNNNIYFTKPPGSDTLTLFNAVFSNNDIIHLEFYQALEDLSPKAIGAEQGGVVTDESGNTIYTDTP